MPSQIELLKEAIERLEPVHGPDNPFVAGLRAQLIGLERQAERAKDRDRFNLEVGGHQNHGVEPEDLAAFNLYEKMISDLKNSK